VDLIGQKKFKELIEYTENRPPAFVKSRPSIRLSSALPASAA